jgi:hypothetical protein
VLENWKQYFNNLLNFETKQAKSNTEIPLQDHDEEEIEIPTYKEITVITLFLNLKEIKLQDQTVLHLS